MICPSPIGVRPADVDELGMDLDEDEGSLVDSVEEMEGSPPDSDVDSVQAPDSVQPEDLDEWHIPADDGAVNVSPQLGSPQLQD